MKDLDQIISGARYKTSSLTCKGCQNNCSIVRYDFSEGKRYYSGNRCEKVFHSSGTSVEKGRNAYTLKESLLFDRASEHLEGARLRIGIPRVLGMFEDFPFYHTLFTRCGIDVLLSPPSDYREYEKTAGMVMSDNLCFPAKLVHSHIDSLSRSGVDRIFFPFVVYGPKGKDVNSYNCPVVSGYPEVVKSVGQTGTPLDTPVLSMKDTDLFRKQCCSYLATLGVDKKTAKEAFNAAIEEREKFYAELVRMNEEIYSTRKGLVILLAGRPYHTDPLIQHKVSGMASSMGVDVITDDFVRDKDVDLAGVRFLPQWTYPNRILRAAKWVAEQDKDVQMVMFTSFGCGPDAFLTDAVRDTLMRRGKSLTLLKIDDIDNVGSMKLRVRSLVDSLKLSSIGLEEEKSAPNAVFGKEDRGRTILTPFFTPFLSPLLPPAFKILGYDIVTLPMSDSVSAELGLRYANNEVCYPATLVVGDILKALSTGKYDPKKTAVAMSQTGGQCRASNYLGLIKKALADAGYAEIPVISFSFMDGVSNDQEGFKINWFKLITMGIDGIMFSDVLAKFYYASAVREKSPGMASALLDEYLKKAQDLISQDKAGELLTLTKEAGQAFNDICREGVNPKKAGIVGEIYLKFNPYAHHRLPAWLTEHGVEVVPPAITDFFIQYFVNRKADKDAMMEKSKVPEFVFDWIYSLVKKRMRSYNEAASSVFSYYMPLRDIFEEAERASKIITLNAQFGEGWLLPGEIASLCEEGVYNVLSLQPFGCIANHIVSRGVERKVKSLYPEINYLAIDFDGGVSEVNVMNRMLLFMDNLK